MPGAAFRITYRRHADLRADLAQMEKGGVMVNVADTEGLELDAPVSLELVLPDGTTLASDGKVLHVFHGVGVAISVPAEVRERVRQVPAGPDAGREAAHHERIDPDAAPAAPAKPTTTPPLVAAMTHAEKIQIALHGNRDQRNAILRDSNRTLHPFVLKNPQLDADDVLAIAKNAQLTPELLRMVGDRKEWMQRPAIALALARNPKTPPEVAVRALDHAPLDAVRQIAKGSGAPPHVVAAARRKVLKP